MIFDTHAHYDDARFDEDRETVIASLPLCHVGYVVNVAASMESVKTSIALAEKYENFYASVGVHPDDVESLTEEDMETLKRCAAHEKVVAIGECGLDYYGRELSPEIQKKWFVRQIQVANEVDLPLIVHSREAAKDTYDILKAERTGDDAGIIHCYAYSKEMARQFLDLGYCIALGGVVTFKNGRSAKEVAAYVPLDKLLLETDSPYLSPEPHRGQRNSSMNLPYVVKQIAELRGISEEEVIRATTENARRLYRIS